MRRNSLANANGRMNDEKFVLTAEIPCEWTFATKFASDCECDGVVHSVAGPLVGFFGVYFQPAFRPDFESEQASCHSFPSPTQPNQNPASLTTPPPPKNGADSSEEENPPEKKKSSSEQVFLNNSRRAPESRRPTRPSRLKITPR